MDVISTIPRDPEMTGIEDVPQAGGYEEGPSNRRRCRIGANADSVHEFIRIYMRSTE
jgi:hypothetical protein